MKFEEHCLECVQKLGKPFEEVHLWLDEFAGSKQFGIKHRHLRHHQQGILEAERIFGKNAGQAARLHIISDLKMEGWMNGDQFPMNSNHYRKMGLF
jgi:hypothetical protein